MNDMGSHALEALVRYAILVLGSLLVACSGKNSPNDDDGDDALPSFDYVIIAADNLAASAARYAEFRGATYETDLALMSDIVGGAATIDDARDALRAHIFTRYESRDASKPFFVLLIGDAEEMWSTGDTHLVPTGSIQGESEDAGLITTDNIFADVDDDDLPDLAIGRIPAASDTQVDTIREKVQAHEATYNVGLWNRRMNIFASTPGFGDFLDTIIENMAFDVVEAMSPDLDVTMTYASQASPFVYVPEEFSDKVYERINEGSLMVTYVGHGTNDGFASLEWNDDTFDILDTGDLASIDVQNRAPILTFIACLTGAFDEGESVSEEILLRPNTPSAILSSTEVSHPLVNTIFIYELGLVLGDHQTATVGEAFAKAKRRMVESYDDLRESIGTLASFMIPPSEQVKLVADHEYMYTLFGDPAMRIAYPRLATVTLSGSATPGATLAFEVDLGDLDLGTAHITLESQRAVILGDITEVPEDGNENRDDVIRTNYATANDKRIVTQEVAHTGGTLNGSLELPSDLPEGTYYLKVYASGSTADASGAAVIEID